MAAKKAIKTKTKNKGRKAAIRTPKVVGRGLRERGTPLSRALLRRPFKRKELVIGGDGDGVVDVLDARGRQLCEIIIQTSARGKNLMVEVYDWEDRYKDRKAVTISPRGGLAQMIVPPDCNFVSVEFKKG